MSSTQVLRISAVVMVSFGLVLLLAPNALVALYKAQEMNGPGIYNSMLYGSSLIAFATMNWSAATQPLAANRHIVLANLVGNSLGFLVALYRQLSDPSVPTAAWLNVVIFLVFALLFARLQLRMKDAASELPGAAPAA
jgi:hypothetical protein